MDKEAIKTFQGPYVTLIKDDGGVPFAIHGHIKEIYDSSLTFSSCGKLLLIDFSRIKEIRLDRS